MSIWLLVLLVMASLAGLGYRQGAIRVAFSLLGIFIGALLAVPLGKLIKPMLGACGLKNPVLVWALAPFVIFVVISALFKIVALPVHQKIDVFYKYKAGDLRLALWERLNRRLGLCLGLLNGTAYVVLLCFVIYPFSYWTVQMETEGKDPFAISVLNRLGHDLQHSGLAKTARAVDGLSPAFYQAADIAGLIYANPLLEARLSEYPAFLSLGERPEFQDLSNDKVFAEMRQRGDPLATVYDYPKIQNIVDNPDSLKAIWAALVPDLTDLRDYLLTGKSAKYDVEPMLGRWKFDVRAALRLVRMAKPTISGNEMQRLRASMTEAFGKTTMVVMTDPQTLESGPVALKNTPSLKGATGPGTGGAHQNLTGTWKKAGARYQLSFPSGEELTGSVSEDGQRLQAATVGVLMAFARED